MFLTTIGCGLMLVGLLFGTVSTNLAVCLVTVAIGGAITGRQFLKEKKKEKYILQYPPYGY